MAVQDDSELPAVRMWAVEMLLGKFDYPHMAALITDMDELAAAILAEPQARAPGVTSD